MLTGIREQLEAASRAAATLRARAGELGPALPALVEAADRDLFEALRLARSPWRNRRGNPSFLREGAIYAAAVAGATGIGALLGLWLPLILPVQMVLAFGALALAGVPALRAMGRRFEDRPGGRPGPDDGRPPGEFVAAARDAVGTAMMAYLARWPGPAGLPERARVQWEARMGRLPLLLSRADVNLLAVGRFLAKPPDGEA